MPRDFVIIGCNTRIPVGPPPPPTGKWDEMGIQCRAAEICKQSTHRDRFCSFPDSIPTWHLAHNMEVGCHYYDMTRKRVLRPAYETSFGRLQGRY